MPNLSDSAAWVPSPCFTHPRESKVTLIVLHWMDTNLAGADATFTSGVRQASAHYGIENGVIHQYVREGDAAWHAGVRSINHTSIGIEHSAAPGRDATAATVATSVALCTELCQRYGLGASAIHQHNDYYATQCPGTLPVAAIRAAVAANLAPPPAPPLPTVTPEEKTMYLAKNANGPDMWVGDGITRSHIANPQTLKDMQYLWQKFGVTVHDLGAVANLDAIGAPVSLTGSLGPTP